MSKKKPAKDPTLPHMINLVVGDWSGDGHSKTETVTVSSNLDKSAVLKAYKKGTKKLGFDLSQDVAADYEDNVVSKEQWEKFAAAGLTLEDLFGSSKGDIDDATEDLAGEEAPGFGVYAEAFAHLWLFIVRQGDSNFRYSINETDSPNINIGGYGLFD